MGVLGLLVLCVSGCTTDGPDPTSGNVQGDCVGRVRFVGVTYRPNQGLHNDRAHRGKALGQGAVVDCRGKPIDHVKVYAIQGVAPGQALMASGGGWHGIYVSEKLPHSAWPATVR
jgi:hypothetical protein